MEEIEREYKEKNKLADVSEMRNLKTTTSEDRLLVRNWQDILSVYIYEQSKKGADTYVLDASCKEELARIFGEMNPVVRDKKDITKVSYGDYHINNYIKKNKIPKEDRAVLKKLYGDRLQASLCGCHRSKGICATERGRRRIRGTCKCYFSSIFSCR